MSAVPAESMPGLADPRRCTAVVLPVPEAEHLVARWRREHTEDGARGMRAHLTVLYPFVPPEEARATIAPLRDVFGGFSAFPFRLARCERFTEGALYLAPEPKHAFVELMRRVQERYPEHPLYDGAFAEIVPHVTVAQADASQLDRIETLLAPRLPLEALACEGRLVTLEPEGWAVWARLPFGGDAS